MEYKFEGKSLKSGIYKITNKLNGRIYIGSAKEFKRRWSQHAASLKANKHQNKFLQSDYNKCGAEAFVFDIIEITECDKEGRLIVEERHIKEHYDNGKDCYNLCDRAISREGYKAKVPEETRRKVSAASKKNWENPEYREKCSRAIKEAISVPEVKEKKRIGHMRSWDGNEERREKTSHLFKELMLDAEYKDKIVKNLLEHQPKGRETFRKRMKEDAALKEKYQMIASEKVKRIKERYIEDPDFKKKMDDVSIRNIQEYNKRKIEEMEVKAPLISPDGVVYDQIKNLNEFAKEHGLDSSSLYKIYKGKLKSVHGWKLFIG
jgi:group I intron endonuclease